MEKVWLIVLCLAADLALTRAQCPADHGAPQAQSDDEAISDEEIDFSQMEGLPDEYDGAIADILFSNEPSLDDHKSLKEIMESTVSPKFERLFNGGSDGKQASALDILNRLKETTKIEKAYLTNVVYKLLDVKSEEELGGIMYTAESCLTLVNELAEHFQSVPETEGRPAAELEELQKGEPQANASEEGDSKESEPIVQDANASGGRKNEL